MQTNASLRSDSALEIMSREPLKSMAPSNEKTLAAWRFNADLRMLCYFGSAWSERVSKKWTLEKGSIQLKPRFTNTGLKYIQMCVADSGSQSASRRLGEYRCPVDLWSKSVCAFGLLQINDAEKIFGTAQSEILIVIAEAYDVALEISPGKTGHDGLVLHKNNITHLEHLCNGQMWKSSFYPQLRPARCPSSVLRCCRGNVFSPVSMAEGCLNFGTLKVFEENKLTIKIKNQGKYDIAFRWAAGALFLVTF